MILIFFNVRKTKIRWKKDRTIRPKLAGDNVSHQGPTKFESVVCRLELYFLDINNFGFRNENAKSLLYPPKVLNNLYIIRRPRVLSTNEITLH